MKYIGESILFWITPPTYPVSLGTTWMQDKKNNKKNKKTIDFKRLHGVLK